MPLEQRYTIQFVPPPQFGRSGHITVQSVAGGENVTVTIDGYEAPTLSWSLSEFDQFERDLGEALVLLGRLSAQRVTRGVYSARVGQWLEIFCQADGWYCNVGHVAPRLQETEVRTILRSLPDVRQAIAEALSTFRRLRQ